VAPSATQPPLQNQNLEDRI